MRNSALFLVILIATIISGCREMDVIDPQNLPDDKATGIYINQSFRRPMGINTLFINAGDTVTLELKSILINDPDYTWISNDESIVKFMEHPDGENYIYAIATGDSGSQTSFSLQDDGNGTTKTLPVYVVKHWADPMFFTFIGSLDNHFYYVSYLKKTWSDARDDCIAQGGHLISINSRAENDLLSLAPERNGLETWIGISFINNNLLRFWVTGEVVGFENYTSKPSEPGIFAEYYFYMQDDGRWENWHEIAYQYCLEME
ncbi:MAG: C-type lectin domain-containing protein [Calditrichae bacterium]|nr:C-type lectin domain-containing protein [Calditrichota bacterium]MCB9057825.1 C-type lectin domain-containing protein [Calditrichia bacterium]